HLPRSTLAAFYASEVLHFSQMDSINRWCHLSSIPYDSRAVQVGGLPWLYDSMSTGDNFVFLTSKRTSRKAVETLNQLNLGLYNYDHQSGLLMRKFVPKFALAERILNGEADFTVNLRPFSMLQLEIPLMFLAIGLTASWAAFLVEDLCPNGTLRLGYTAEAFPKSFFRNGRMIGYVVDYWSTVRKARCEMPSQIFRHA
ncbi:hypothetical protein PMAYCL1PPCAC_22983, partial [Pristionchus mayeri]